MADRPTPLEEAVEQTDDGLRQCWDAVALLIKGDLDKIESGTYRLGDAATVGARLLIVGVGNMFKLGEVMSDNLALLAADPSPADPPRYGTAAIPIAVPAGAADVTVRPTDLVGLVTGQQALRTRVSVDPPVLGAGAARQEVVTVTLAAAGLPNDTYSGALVVDGPDGPSTTDYIVGVSGLP